MEKKCIDYYRLRVQDYNCYDIITPYCLLDILQDIAGKHCDSYDMSYDNMLSQNMAWILVRTSYEVVKPFGLYETLKVTTWPKEKGLVDFDRETIMEDSNNDIVIKATSKWLIIDYKTRQIIPAKHIKYNAPCPDKEQFIYQTGAKKVQDFSVDNLMPYNYKIEFNDVDHNGHVNNSRYAYILMNAIKPTKDEIIRKFDINFVHEIFLDDIISIYYVKQDKTYKIKGITNNQTTFLCEIELF